MGSLVQVEGIQIRPATSESAEKQGLLSPECILNPMTGVLTGYSKKNTENGNNGHD